MEALGTQMKAQASRFEAAFQVHTETITKNQTHLQEQIKSLKNVEVAMGEISLDLLKAGSKNRRPNRGPHRLIAGQSRPK